MYISYRNPRTRRSAFGRLMLHFNHFLAWFEAGPPVSTHETSGVLQAQQWNRPKVGFGWTFGRTNPSLTRATASIVWLTQGLPTWRLARGSIRKCIRTIPATSESDPEPEIQPPNSRVAIRTQAACSSSRFWSRRKKSLKFLTGGKSPPPLATGLKSAYY